MHRQGGKVAIILASFWLFLENNSLSSNKINRRMPVSHGGQTKKPPGKKKKKSLKQSSALLWAKPFIQLAVDTTIPGILFYVTNHSKHMHGQHMLNKIVHMASLILKWRQLCRRMLQGGKLAAGQVHCWPLMVRARLTWSGTVSRTRWKDPPTLVFVTPAVKNV